MIHTLFMYEKLKSQFKNLLQVVVKTIQKY